MFSTKTICINPERDIKGDPAVCSWVSAILQEHATLKRAELFMPTLDGNLYQVYCHTDPTALHDVDERAEAAPTSHVCT